MRAREFLSELRKFSHVGHGYGDAIIPSEEWRGPHQGKELQMMLAGVKPAAIINASDLGKWEPYVKDGTFIATRCTRNLRGQRNTYVIALPDEKYRLNKIKNLLELPLEQGKIAPAIYHVKLGRLLGYEKGHINTFLDKTKQFREDADNMQTLYHVTLTKSVPNIQKKGICLLQTTNWTKGTGERYGNGNIFAFDTLIDAIRWAGKWDYDQNSRMGTGKVSIVTFKADPMDWTEDPAEDYAKMSAQGKWLTSDRHVPKQNIISITPATSEVIRSGVITESQLNELATNPYDYVQTRNMAGKDVQYMFETAAGEIYTIGLKWVDNELEIGFGIKDVSTGKHSYDITGTGDAFRVFATIKEVVRSYLASRSAFNGLPKHISFSGKSEDKSRLKLYDTIARTASKWLPGYNVSEILDYGDHRYYELTRNEGEIDEGWKEWVGAAGIGAAALGMNPTADEPATKPITHNTIVAPQAEKQPPFIKNLSPIENSLITVAQQAGITGSELRQFLAQCAHETLNFKFLRELGSDKQISQRYDKKFNPKKAKLLGNTKVGDGVKYKGRGFLQLTGKYNYAKASQALSIPLLQQPELAEQPEVAAKIAVWFWKLRVQPRVKDFTNVAQSTKPINPAMRGMRSRQEKYDKYAQTDQPANI